MSTLNPTMSRTLGDDLIREGDRLRDLSQATAAAAKYAQALLIMPERTDIAVQYGNMLKDSGRYQEAEATYQRALVTGGEDADIYIQLGHALKLDGRRSQALNAYRRALALDPNCAAAQAELFHAGQTGVNASALHRSLLDGSFDALAVLGQQVAAARRELDRMAAMLPDLLALTAFPPALYGTLRERFDVPPPPATAAQARSFRIVLHADGDSLPTLFAQLSAIHAQTFLHWTLQVVGRCTERQAIVGRYAAADPRIEWVPGDECTIPPSNAAAWSVLCARGALLHQHALAWFDAAATRGGARALICDEEILPESISDNLALLARQAVDYDTLLESNVYGETLAIDAALLASMAPHGGGLSPAEASWLLLLNAVAVAAIGHVPYPLVSRRAPETCSPSRVELVLRRHLMRNGLADRATVFSAGLPDTPAQIHWKSRDADSRIAVLIPSRDNGHDAIAMVDSLRANASHPDALDIVVIDNGSRDPVTCDLLAALASSHRARLLRIDEPFNWSRLSNFAAAGTDAPLLVFANDDMRMLSVGWDDTLRGLLERPEVGAVGARLLYPDGSVQHAGVLFGWRGMDTHDGRGATASDEGPAERWRHCRAVSAVTGAFLATRRQSFFDHGPFDEQELAVSYGDLDYALRLRQAGHCILWSPAIVLRHHESKSRGHDHRNATSQARAANEAAVFSKRWGEALHQDPSVNPFWHDAAQPFRLLSWPSKKRVFAHIDITSRDNPWQVAGPGL